MIMINKAILHILDFNSGITVFSEQELNIQSESVETFLTKHIEKSFKDSNLKTGTFLDESMFKQKLINYTNEGLEFVDFSTYIANSLYMSISKSDKVDSLDLLICDFNIENERFIGILECANRIGFTHQVLQDEGKVKNEIINHYAILPNVSQKLTGYAFINTNLDSIKFIDKKRYIDGNDTFILPDIVLECSWSMSSKDAVNLIKSITCKIAENHGESGVLAISKAKNFIIENSEISERLEPEELVKEVFESSEIMQEEFIKEARTAGIPEAVKVNKNFAVRTSKNHKIKTDTGIEISFPVDYFQNKDFIEIINNPNGTISIQLKNIGKIVNK